MNPFSLETLIATLIFWISLEFSFSSFWVGIMELSNKVSLKKIVIDYTIFMMIGFLPLVVIICSVIAFLGGINKNFFIIWHFIGAAMIFYLSYKALIAKITNTDSFKYGVREMCLTNWSNPKVYLMIPTGYLVAQFTDSTLLNITLFYWIGFPICIAGVIFWYYVGRIGAKLFINKLSFINAALLAVFGVYLIYNAFKLMSER